MLSEVKKDLRVQNTTLILGGRDGGRQGKGIGKSTIQKGAILRKCLNTFVPHCRLFKSNMYSIVSWSYFELILWISKYKRINGNYFMIIFYLKTQRLILKSTLRNTSLIMDPFTQVKSAEDIVKSTTTLYLKKGCISLKKQTNKQTKNKKSALLQCTKRNSLWWPSRRG